MEPDEASCGAANPNRLRWTPIDAPCRQRLKECEPHDDAPLSEATGGPRPDDAFGAAPRHGDSANLGKGRANPALTTLIFVGAQGLPNTEARHVAAPKPGAR